MHLFFLRPITSASLALQGFGGGVSRRVQTRDFFLHNRLTAATTAFPYAVKMSTAASLRTESDAFGNIDVESSRYWGAQTQRSLQNFPIGGRESRMPIEVIKGTLYDGYKIMILRNHAGTGTRRCSTLLLLLCCSVLCILLESYGLSS